ncbi:hypothetical protein MVES1_001857 [Malassezia vespertilionis]|uniref:Amino acid transporter transmembrane domain-containing protein n=1 Tax=Malassezia vespertilionis TaxID=2020962 RepID=A0A2N1JDE2_9BASI|nr:uncharacterized protein MVES1_001857 [Malassezia vespertilionis]PKI84581.1 hypothetical protein MVES_001757 [Malassezia vespertilionis]WFD06510.1 hypothetical protein MVES1_001857 [Malassezia vespertilionis]
MRFTNGAEQQAEASDTDGTQPDVIRLHIPGEEDNFFDRENYDVSGVDADQEDEAIIHVWDEESDEELEAYMRKQKKPLLPFVILPEQHAPTPGKKLRSLASWWRTLLIGSAAPGTLSVGHVAMNMASTALHPGVLLAMPVYFIRAGVVPGFIVFVLTTMLSAFGGALWVTLGRYVGSSSIESVTGKAFGMNTQWKRKLGIMLSSAVLMVYCTGAAVVGYHAMTDLLLQVFFHYTPTTSVFHDRAFVTLVVGGIMTLPVLVAATPQRHIMQVQSWSLILCYPAIIAILYVQMKDWHLPSVRPKLEPSWPSVTLVPMPHLQDYTWPWASTAMVPLLVLSALPAQILAQSRSLQRKAVYDSNVHTFYLAQSIQAAVIIAITFFVGVDIGLVGTDDLHRGLYPNFFSALPLDDDKVNIARGLFCLLLASHLCLCLTSASSACSRILKALGIQFKPLAHGANSGVQRAASPRLAANTAPHEAGAQAIEARKKRRFWRGAASGLVLWCITAFTAYSSGVGGVFRREEKEGKELRFLRSVEVIGIMGAVVGFILPAVIWLVLFRIRRPRAILLAQTESMQKRLQQYLLSPLSALIPVLSRQPARSAQEAEPLLQEQDGNAYGAVVPEASIPRHENEYSASDRDEGTYILLARKERQLQRVARGRRILQEFIVVVVLLPFGLFLVVSASIELAAGGY